MSPVWPLRPIAGAAANSREFGGAQFLFFIGPVQPALVSLEIERLETDASLALWLSAGCFNVVAIIDESDRSENLLIGIDAWARDQGVPYECWKLHDGLIIEQSHFALPAADDSGILSEIAELAERYDDPTVHTTLQENIVVSATTLARLSIMHPPLHSAVRAVTEDMRDTLLDRANGNLSVLQLQSALLSANAALSRFSSQALSGIPPITATECHFWIHSLLGTGSANIALAALVSSIQKVMGEAKVPERLAALAERTGGVPSLHTLTRGVDLLTFDLMRETEPVPTAGQIVPLVCYFSGRDGFSSQVKSLSAPLSTLAECNSRRSSLLTVTHEISHIFVQAVLTLLMPPLNDKAAIADAQRLVSGKYQSVNYLEAVRQLLLEAVVGMEIVSRDMKMAEEEIPLCLPSMLERWRHELQEIIVHTFDFLYFYAGDPEFYIKGIWHSWCAIPGIGDRVPEYLMRTLCAVSANLLDADASVRFNAALRHVKEILAEVRSEIGHSPNYIDLVLAHVSELEADNAKLTRAEQEYSLRLYLTRLVKIFLYSDDLAAQVFADSHAAGGDGYAAKKPLRYDFIPIGNILRFLKEHLKQSPSEAESLWVLHCIAFDASFDAQRITT